MTNALGDLHPRARPPLKKGIILKSRLSYLSSRSERWAGKAFVLPAVLVVLFLSIFPLIVSLYLSFAHMRFFKGQLEINFVGWHNYYKLLFGSGKTHFLGLMRAPSLVGWLILLGVVVLLALMWVRYVRGKKMSIGETSWRLLASVVVLGGTGMLVYTLGNSGRPGTVSITLIYVLFGISAQYLLGLGLALMCVQRLPGQRFFRTIFLIPMMITPVGIAYLFRMLTDTGKGPLTPLWQALGWSGFSWTSDPWGARIAVMIGDLWQWTPFMFVVLLAALESRSKSQLEAAQVDGANAWAMFLHITVPQILPVSATLVLIRLIEAFKIVDLPNIMTNGGPGTATESMTLQAYFAWRTLDLGGASAIAYLLMVVVTLVCLTYFNLIHRKVAERL